METVISFGCRPASVITCLTRQDSHTVHGISPLEPDSVIANLDCLLDDFGTPDAIKTGLIGDAELIKRLADRLSGIDCPIVVDPRQSSTPCGKHCCRSPPSPPPIWMNCNDWCPTANTRTSRPRSC
ncbi:MAG: bifunctional hydroxymethylpyrimidine kinase/phosphomethylpyrimidine kinase [Gammaproteobacteria bacterium]